MRALVLVMCITWAEGCLIVDPDGPSCIGDFCHTDVGDILFYWEFELQNQSVTDDCALAGVTRVDTFVWDDAGNLEFQVLNRPCGDRGLELQTFMGGDYELELKAYCPTGLLTHHGVYSIPVYSGDNDYGFLALDYLGPCL